MQAAGCKQGRLVVLWFHAGILWTWMSPNHESISSQFVHDCAIIQAEVKNQGSNSPIWFQLKATLKVDSKLLSQKNQIHHFF